MRAFITGGAGFIGSNLADRLLEEGHEVIVYDNFSTGQQQFVEHNLSHPNYQLIEGDVLDKPMLTNAMRDSDMVFHFQAHSDVRGGIENTYIDLEQNVTCTHNVLEAMKIHNMKRIAFASASSVYGNPSAIPTPETTAPCPISLNGASKASAEALILAYCEYFEMHCWIFRFSSILGPRYNHGVVFDFVKNLKKSSSELYILGDGTQRKTFLHIEDVISAIQRIISSCNEKVNTFNVGNKEYANISEIAEWLCLELKTKDVQMKYSGGKTGWKGDAPFVFPDTSKLLSLGWTPKYSIKESLADTILYLSQNEDLLYSRR